LFKDGSFRWNRLENLLKNAQNSEDYDINQVLDQTLEFLFSERGELIREQLAHELVKGIDLASRNALTTAQSKVAEWMGVKVSSTPTTAPQPTTDQNNLEHIQRIVSILQETKGFDPMLLVQRVPGLMVKPEVQHLSQKVAGELAQRATARMIRELFLSSDPLIFEDNQLGSIVEKNGNYSNRKSPSQQPLSLPPSR